MRSSEDWKAGSKSILPIRMSRPPIWLRTIRFRKSPAWLPTTDVVVRQPVDLRVSRQRWGRPSAVPSHGATRWRALKFQSLGDGILDAAVPCRGEQGKPSEAARDAQIARFKAAMSRAVDALEADPPHKHIDIGSITVGCALGYLDFRFGADPWREGHPVMAAWYAEFSRNQALRETAP